MVAAACLGGRRRRLRPARAVAIAVAIAPSTAWAHGFMSERFQPSAGRYDILAIESALVPAHLGASAAVYLSYSRRPLRLVAPGAEADLLASQMTLTAGASLGLLDRFELSAAAPIVLHQSALHVSGSSPETSGLGDVLLVPKARVYGGSMLGLALAVPLSLPTGRTTSLLGYGHVTANPRLIAEIVASRLRLAVNAGVALRGRRRVLEVDVGNAVTYGLGAEVPFRFARQRLAAVATVAGEAQLARGARGEPPLELMAGLSWRGPAGFAMTAGGGPGLGTGYGTPQYRVLAALSYSAAGEAAPQANEPSASEPGDSPTHPQPGAATTAGLPSERVAQTPRARVLPRALPRAEKQYAHQLVVIRGGIIRFQFQSFDIDPGFAPALDRVTAALKADPSIRVRIEGHADEIGSAAAKQDVSEKRALAVRAALVERGIAPERLDVVGLADTRPLDPAHTLRAHVRNRRVELVPLPSPPRR